MQAASHGSVIGPSVGKPNSSSDILRSSRKMLLVRYFKGTMKRLPSVVYMNTWPLLATRELGESAVALVSEFFDMILLLPKADTFCHFLTILMSFFGFSMAAVCEGYKNALRHKM